MNSMKVIQQNPHIIESSQCISNMLWVIDLSLIFLICFEEYIQFQKNQSTQQYSYQYIIKPFTSFAITIYDIHSLFYSR